MTPEQQADLARLREIRLDLEAYEARMERLYAERLDLYERLRAGGVWNRIIGEASGVSDVAVVQALRKAGRLAAREAPA